jgi:thiol-disulfide isomerase/thioredoxin
MSEPTLLQRLFSWYSERRQSRVFRWSRDALLLVALLFGVGLWQTRNHVRDVPLPTGNWSTLSGESLSLQSFQGKPTLLALFAPWCGVCGAEAPNIERVRRWVGDRARVVSVALSYDDVHDVRAYVQKNNVQGTVVLGDDALARALRVQAFPTVYFVDEEGKVKGSSVGYTPTFSLLFRLLW